MCTCFSMILVLLYLFHHTNKKGTELNLTVGVVCCAMPCHAMRDLGYVMLC